MILSNKSKLGVCNFTKIRRESFFNSHTKIIDILNNDCWGFSGFKDGLAYIEVAYD